MKENRRIDTHSKARLKWFLDFLYIDIDSLSPIEFFKLLTESQDILYDPDLFLWMLNKSPMEISHPYRRQETKEIQAHLKKTLEHILGRRTLDQLFNGDSADLRVIVDLVEQIGFFEIPFVIAVQEDRVFLVPARRKEALTAEFVNSLHAFALRDIKPCEREDCGKYFLKATKKEKRYCSNKCAWVMASRKRREINAEKEREKKRLSYERRKKRELGPKVKVQTRKRKEGKR